ncbi:MAG: hypothetical protein KA354_01950 [Phycisphaerae bacterium]|nr:hypothetical protein [Phycisphaerae bacterium]
MKPSLICTKMMVVAVLGMWVPAGPALATNITWDFQRVSSQAPSPPMVSLGMRTGDTWPTVFYNRAGFTAASLTPVGWSETALGTSADNLVRAARARDGSDGRVGIAWLNGGREVLFAQSSRYGWQASKVGTAVTSSSVSGPDFAYTSDDRPVVTYTGLSGNKAGLVVSAYDGLGWNTDLVDKVTVSQTVRIGGDLPTIAVDSQDRIGLGFRSNSEVIFATKDLAQGSWYGTSLGSTFPSSSSMMLSLGYGANDHVAMAIKSNNLLWVSHFDIQSGAWVTEQLSVAVASQAVNLAFDSQGHPAVAFSGSDDVIHYMVNRGDGWTDVVLPLGTDPTSGLVVNPVVGTDAALAFDRFDNPVIAYVGSAGLILAYDPVVTPEPASLLMGLFGLVVLCARRR